MASTGRCGHGVRVKMPLHLAQCQALIASGNTERRCQQTIKISTMPDAGKKDGSLKETRLSLRFLGLLTLVASDH